jgi:hypothetical protein
VRNLSAENWKIQKERKGAYKKRKKIPTAELNRRDQVTATKSWPSALRKEGTEVDYQVAAPNESSTPKLHRAKIAQQRVRMEGWRQERLGSRAGTHTEKEKNKNILTGKEKRKTYLTLTGLLMEGLYTRLWQTIAGANERPVENSHFSGTKQIIPVNALHLE